LFFKIPAVLESESLHDLEWTEIIEN